MKKFIFGVMLLVSLLGIVGCSNPSNSDGSEDDTYIVKNVANSEITISYRNKSGEWTNKQTIPVNGTYEIPANDAKTGTVENVPIIYVKLTLGTVSTVAGLNLDILKKGVYEIPNITIKYIEE